MPNVECNETLCAWCQYQNPRKRRDCPNYGTRANILPANENEPESIEAEEFPALTPVEELVPQAFIEGGPVVKDEMGMPHFVQASQETLRAEIEVDTIMAEMGVRYWHPVWTPLANLLTPFVQKYGTQEL